VVSIMGLCKLLAGEGGWKLYHFSRQSCIIVRNVIPADEVVDTVESSGHYSEIGYFLF